MDTYEKIYSTELREEIQHLRKRYNVPTQVMRELAKHGTRSVRYNSDVNVSDYIDNLDDTFGVNVADGVLTYLNSLMDVITSAREKIQAEDTVGRFQKKPRMSLEGHLAANASVFNNDFIKAFSRFKVTKRPSQYNCEGVLFGFGKKQYDEYLDFHSPDGETVALAKRWNNSTDCRLINVVDEYCHQIDLSHKDKLQTSGFVVKVGLDYLHRKSNDLHNVRVGSKDYLVTHATKVDHPYVDEADRACYKAHIVGVSKTQLDYKIGYLVTHTGHSKVTKAFGEGDTGAKSASQLLDRRLKKSVVDTLMDSL